jgi:2',3'-cyclic-nucleotide 2'-phosphodiesterase / 3'-nucleotidase / 5'-nucleotidase
VRRSVIAGATSIGLVAALAAYAPVAGAQPTPNEPSSGPATTVDAASVVQPGTTFGFVGRASVTLDAGEETDAEVAAISGRNLYAIDRVTSGDSVAAGVRLFDISNPAAPVSGARIDLSSYGGDINSVAASGAYVAAAMEADPKTDRGTVVLMRLSGTELKVIATATAGALPDMVTFDAAGKRLWVANEGEPSGYGPGTIDPEGSITIINVARMVAERPGAAKQLTFRAFNDQKAALQSDGVRIFGPGATVAQDVEPEYITVDPDNRNRAWVSLQENNALATINMKKGKITKITALGLKQHYRAGNGLDASDRDGRVNVRTWPVRGMYQPDGIAAFVIKGKTYIASANEGDAREYDGLEEEVRVGDDEFILNPEVFGNTTQLKEDANLGRLTVTTEGAKKTGDAFDQILAFGARSMSIWSANGKQVYDSGDALEAVTAARMPRWFNSTNDESEFDNRSDNKGPEPEGVAVGTIGKRTYAFVALERIGGLAIFDVTNPKNAKLTQLLNTRDFLASSAGPDAGAEAVTFVSAKDSPNGQPLVAVSNEVSATVTLWQPVDPDGAASLTLLHNNDGESALLGKVNEAEGKELPVGSIGAFSTVTQQQISDARNLGNSVVNVYAGDAFLASALLACSLPPNPESTPVYDAVAQRLIPYDAHILGNHEFDFGPGFLERFASTFTNGTNPNQPFISGNLDFSTDSQWQPFIDGSGIVTTGAVVNGKIIGQSAIVNDIVTGARFGIVSAIYPQLNTISSPAPVTVTSTDLTATASQLQAQIDSMTSLGVSKIIFVGHMQGIASDKELLGLLTGVDIAVAGGGDDILANSEDQLLPGDGEPAGPYPTYESDKAGVQVPIVTAAGNYKYLGRIDASFDASGNLAGVDQERSYPRMVLPTSAVATELGVVQAVASDELIDESIAPVTTCLEANDNAIASSAVKINVSRQGNSDQGFTTGVRTGETNGGDFIADGYLASYDRYAARAGLPARSRDNLVAAVQNGGGVRQNAGDVLPVGGTVPGPITRNNTLNTLAFLTNVMSVIADMDAAEMKQVFERSFASRAGADCASGSAGGQFLQVSNLRVIADCSKTAQEVSEEGVITTAGERITYLAWDPGTPRNLSDDIAFVENGAVVLGAPTISLVTNSFTANGGDNYPAFKAAEKTLLGLSYEQSLVEYFTSFPVVDGLPTVPASDTRYSSPTGEGRITAGAR